MQRRIRFVTAATAPLTAVLALLLTVLGGPVAAAGPPNTPPRGLHHCSAGGAITASCLKGALRDFKRARAREGLGPMTLPTNFASLSIPAQLMVLADLDRVDRRRRPVAGLSSVLQAYAQAGADRRSDPVFPSWTQEGGSNWASTPSSLWSEFLWMYDDGPGAGNIDCTTASAAGCYGHRRNILAKYHRTILMGAGSARGGGATQLFLGRDSHDRADVATWVSERRLIPVGVSKHHLRARALKHGAKLIVWASGRAMKVHVEASHGMHVNRKRCKLRAGHACTLTVRGTGHGTLTVKGPNGIVAVRLGR